MALALGLAAALALGAVVPDALAREFRAADNQTEDYPTVQALLYMGRLVAERTGGRHQMRVFHSRQLGEEVETIAQTRAGALDLNRVNVAPISNIVPMMNVLQLPFLFRSGDHLHKVLDGPIGQEILASLEPHGFIGLTFYDSGARSIYNSVKPIRTLADVKGMRIRVQQSELAVDMIKALGATPIEFSYGQVGTALTTKLIDGAENNWPSYVTTNHFKSAHNYTLTEHSMSPEVLVISKKAWNSLSAEDKQIFRNAARDSNLYMRDQWKALEDKSRRLAEAAGNIIITDFDRKPFEDAMAPVYEKAAKDPQINRLIERIRLVQ